MPRKLVSGAWYSDTNLEKDIVCLFRDSHIEVNGARIELPVGKFGRENVVQLCCKRWQGQMLIAGQGQVGDKGSGNWLYIDRQWKLFPESFGTFACAFSDSDLYLVVAENRYKIYNLEKDTLTDPIGKQLGAQGIRYIDFMQSPDGIVSGDNSYGPQPYNLSQWTQRGAIVIGQSSNPLGCVSLLGKDYRLIEPGNCEFIKFYFKGNNLTICIVKQLDNESVFHWMTVDEYLALPIISQEVPKKEPKEEPVPEVLPDPPNKISTVKRMLRLHPEIDLADEVKRGKLVDYVIHAEGGGLWGRKARNKDGSNKNSDGLTWLIPTDAENRFYVIDILAGVDPDEVISEEREKYATWDVHGPFKPGENGYWAEGELIDNAPPKDEPKEEPKPKEDEVTFKSRVDSKTMGEFIARMNLELRNTTFGRNNPNDVFPIQTTSHIMFRYFFEHETYSDDALIAEAVARANGTWKD